MPDSLKLYVWFCAPSEIEFSKNVSGCDALVGLSSVTRGNVSTEHQLACGGQEELAIEDTVGNEAARVVWFSVLRCDRLAITAIQIRPGLQLRFTNFAYADLALPRN